MRSKGRKRVYVFFGLIASGKSLLASSWAKKHGFAYVNSDVERKRLAGMDPRERCFGPMAAGIYSESYNRSTYDRLIDCARTEIETGQNSAVVLDGSYQSRSERNRLIAALTPVSVIFIYCFCTESVTRNRLKRRRTDPEAVSDGTLEIYYEQKKRFDEPEEIGDELFRLDTDAPIEQLIEILDGNILNKKGGSA